MNVGFLWKEKFEKWLEKKPRILKGRGYLWVASSSFFSLSVSLSIHLYVFLSFCLSIFLCYSVYCTLWHIAVAVTLCVLLCVFITYQQAGHIGRWLINTDPQTVIMSKRSICVPGDLCLFETHCEGSRWSEVHSTRPLGGCHTPPRWLLQAPPDTQGCTVLRLESGLL